MKTILRFPALILGLLLLAPAEAAPTRYVRGDVIVTFKTSATLSRATAALKKKSLHFKKRFRTLSVKRKRQTGLVHDGRKSTARLIAELKKDPTVETAEPNYIRWINAVPNDTRFSEMWALQNTGQTVNGITGTASADVKFLAARALARAPLGEIVVGVLDTGVDIAHPDLAAHIWVNPLETPLNGTDDDGDGYTDDSTGYDFASGDADPSDSGYHGTHVAGTIAAIGDNQKGIIGVNDKVRLLPLKVSATGDSMDSAAIISATEYATLLKRRGVNIVALNASYGGGGSTSAERASIQAAGDAGILFCAAAG
ncbi:MAG: S8 family serine peptidase, partial [Chthoniobacterales bacterium]